MKAARVDVAKLKAKEALVKRLFIDDMRRRRNATMKWPASNMNGCRVCFLVSGRYDDVERWANRLGFGDYDRVTR